jgi:hypothetical protein
MEKHIMAQGRYFTIKLEVKPRTARGWIAKGKAVVASATRPESVTLLTSIASLLSQVQTDLGVADGAEAAVANKGKTDYSNRNVKLGSLQKSLRAYVAGLQGLCDTASDMEHALQIAAAAGLAPKDKSVPNKAELSGKAVGNASVHLFAKLPAKKTSRIFHEWLMSKDGGATWIALPGTNDASTLVQGLPVGTTVWFRHRMIVKNTPTDWSQHIEIPVR